MPKIKPAIYKCDFCERESDGEQDWIFQRVWDTRSVHEPRRYFGLCHECSSQLPAKESVAVKVMKRFGLRPDTSKPSEAK